MFQVGQNVVCIDDSDLDEARLGDVNVTAIVNLRPDIVRGNIYQIRWIGIYQGDLCVRLVGVKRGPVAGFRLCTESDVPFFASRFRPLVDRKTDTSVFTALLNTQKQPEDAV